MKSTILIVEDEEKMRYLFKAQLEGQGNDIYTAGDYDSALEVISETEIDLIITDIILGGCTGVDLLREVKNRGLDCLVVMVTGEPSLQTAAEAVRLGAFDYLPKPFNKATLRRVAGHALDLKKLMDERREWEERSERYRRNLEAVFRSVKDAIITVDNEGRVLEANNAVNTICGVSLQQIKDERLDKVRFTCTMACHQVLYETLNKKKAVDEYRVECRRRNRPHQITLVSGSPLLDHDDTVIGAVLVLRDITKVTHLEQVLSKRFQFHKIIGKSEKMQSVYRLIRDLADTDTTVLITGESGTGKELAAKAVHLESIRSKGPFVSVSCSALAENLLESELFGHVKGAFTGAVKDKVGRFQMADNGSIFLDEIGDISPVIQLKLLRFLQEKEFERVGDSSKPVKVDVRVIAATNRDLRKMVRLGEFREDLYYRLRVVEIVLPPLRERREDIPFLVDHFCTRFERKMKRGITGVSGDVMTAFMKYPWPGNVRELEHAMEYAFVICHERTIILDHIPPEIREYSGEKYNVQGKKFSTDPQSILAALNRTDWNKAKAARLLGIDRRTIYRKIEEHNLVRPEK
ncbi:MAG: sigma-54-dependent Fis family transcriptional regulator [Desulfobulbaceae bacterium]|nr:sigma-54-dependent Fis family transcriptional regulator [Desulfobulbaceae bacterium]MCK5322607.1 sigma-54-dependent Fis family transcriptional regulator [Desulfobulbaceae bacterium]MCK5544697.1 sigma-54-dependent Fis family transcriptional regulator [Desulfobulbaceae bacterium]